MVEDNAPELNKAPGAFRTISEVAEDLRIPQHVLRFWETKFTQIRPLKRGGNRRYYRPDDIDLLRAINHLLYVDGYTIRGVQKLLKEQGPRAVISQPRTSQASPRMEPAFAPPVVAAPDDTTPDDLQTHVTPILFSAAAEPDSGDGPESIQPVATMLPSHSGGMPADLLAELKNIRAMLSRGLAHAN